MSECVVCQEVSGHIELPGGALESGEYAVVFHIPPLDGGDVFLGHLLVVPKRHVADFAGLHDVEASEIGILVSRWSGALKRSGAEHVYLATIGHSADHLHVHLLPRWPETPTHVPWHSVDDWPGARHANFAEATLFATRLGNDWSE
jgi:histidine triad (HIT) family protein